MNAANGFQWLGHRIAGKWHKGPGDLKGLTSVNPNDGMNILTYGCSKETVLATIKAASSVQAQLEEASLKERMTSLRRLANLLREHGANIVRSMTIEGGKPAWDARAEVEASLHLLDWYESHFGTIANDILAVAKLNGYGGEVSLLPCGTVAAYLPPCTPVIAYTTALAAALWAGCPIVFFTSEHSVLSGLILAGLDEKLDLPAGTINFVFADFTAFKHVINEPAVAAVIFSGPREQCDELKKRSSALAHQRLLLQDGGKNSALVHSSADLDLAVRAIVYGAFKSAGQLGSSTSRVFVYRSLLRDFIQALVKAVSEIRIGPTDAADDLVGPLMGPLASKKALDNFLRFQTMANREGEETICWGRAHDSLSKKGFFVQPGVHLMKEFDAKSVYQSSVSLSPALAIYSYDVLKDVIDQINTGESQHAIAFFGDPEIVRDRSTHFIAPNLLINLPTVEIREALPLNIGTNNGQALYSGSALAYHLCYPQIVVDSLETREIMRSWPWFQ